MTTGKTGAPSLITAKHLLLFIAILLQAFMLSVSSRNLQNVASDVINFNVYLGNSTNSSASFKCPEIFSLSGRLKGNLEMKGFC